jgi:hypothetical protein
MHRSTWRTNATRSVLPVFLLVLAFSVAGCGDDDDSPTGPQQPAGPTVLVLGDDRSETHVSATLADAGFEVRDGGLFHGFTGNGLDGVDAVVLLAGYDYDHDMQDTGEAALVAFVQAGGGLLTTEWLAFSIERSGYHQVLQTILPVRYGGSYGNGTETWNVLVDHPVTENVPSSFATESSNQYSTVAPKSGATQLVRGSRSGASVVTWTRTGRVVSLNMAAEYGDRDVWNADLDQLFVDAVEFVAKR